MKSINLMKDGTYVLRGQPPRHVAGFTLVELLVVMGMIGIFMAAVFSLYQTHQRSAYTQEETAEVQQNLRVGMDSIMDDIRMGGFLVTSSNPPIVFTALNDNGGLNGSDTLVLNTASASLAIARSTSPSQTWTLTPAESISRSVSDIDTFGVGDEAAIIGAMDGNLVVADVFTVTEANTTATGPCGGGATPAPCLTLRATVGGTLTVKPGDMIVRTGGPNFPNTVTYSLVNNAVDINCPVGQTCIQRASNDGLGPQIIATNITNLQVMYILQNGTEVAAPTDVTQVHGIRATLTGTRVNTVAYTPGNVGPRNLVSVAAIRNKF